MKLTNDSMIKEIKMDKKAIARDMREAKTGMFGERDTVDEAIEYAHSMLPNDKAPMTIALMVYHNTLIESICRLLEQDSD